MITKLDEIIHRFMNAKHHLDNVMFEMRQTPTHEKENALKIYEGVEQLKNEIDKQLTEITTFIRKNRLAE